jgi:hypothetical protein
VLVAVLMLMVALVDDRTLQNARVRLFVLAKNRPVGCPKVAHAITLASEGLGTLTWPVFESDPELMR